MRVFLRFGIPDLGGLRPSPDSAPKAAGKAAPGCGCPPLQTSEVLQVISGSPGELDPVLQAVLENATRLCDAKFGTLNRYHGEIFRNVALYNVPSAYLETKLHEVIRPHPKSGHAHMVRTKQVVHIEDLTAMPPYREGDPRPCRPSRRAS